MIQNNETNDTKCPNIKMSILIKEFLFPILLDILIKSLKQMQLTHLVEHVTGVIFNTEIIY